MDNKIDNKVIQFANETVDLARIKLDNIVENIPRIKGKNQFDEGAKRSFEAAEIYKVSGEQIAELLNIQLALLIEYLDKYDDKEFHINKYKELVISEVKRMIDYAVIRRIKEG